MSYVSVELDGVFVVKNIKILRRKIDNGFLLAMPARTKPDGTYADIAHPLTTEFRRVLEDRIFADFKRKQTDAPVHTT